MGELLSIMFISAMGCIGIGAVLVGVGTIMWVKNENQIMKSSIEFRALIAENENLYQQVHHGKQRRNENRDNSNVIRTLL